MTPESCASFYNSPSGLLCCFALSSGCGTSLSFKTNKTKEASDAGEVLHFL